MHWEQGNKMAFHAIILCNKTPEARKMINNVSCVSQLLPKIKRSSAPSAAPARVQVRALPQTPEPRSRRSTCCRSSGHGPSGPRESAECNRGGQKGALSSGRCQERAGSPRRARHPRRQQRACRPAKARSQAAATCASCRRQPRQMRAARGCRGAQGVTSRLCLEPGAGGSLVLSRKLCVLPVHHYSC